MALPFTQDGVKHDTAFYSGLEALLPFTQDGVKHDTAFYSGRGEA